MITEENMMDTWASQDKARILLTERVALAKEENFLRGDMVKEIGEI